MRSLALMELPWRDPALAALPFVEEPWTLALLSGGGGPRGRWSYVARAPQATLTVWPSDRRDVLASLADLLGPVGSAAGPEEPEAPPFTGGVAGLATYELAERVEPIGMQRQPDWPDLAAALYPALLAFDHERGRVLAVGRGQSAAAAQVQAVTAARWLQAPAAARACAQSAAALHAADGRAYEAAVAEVVEKIASGEIFQANIGRSWSGRLSSDCRPFDVMQRLRAESPAPFAAYLRLDGLALVSNSPERFLSVRGRRAETRPIKGTRPRGRNPKSDADLAGELLASVKDRAENLMIVDLMRNDLAKVCRPGTVRAPALFEIESFANVHHLVSTVEGELAQGRSALDLLWAAYPPGSITGAPKVQAMKTIARLERPRGPYCGSLFWAGQDGGMDSSVLIRTIACVEEEGGWRIEARAGAGVVADSDPRAERLETEAKIAAITRALRARTS